MILALMAAAAAADPYDAVLAAERQARDCEMRIVSDAFLSPVSHSMDEWNAAAHRQCIGDWNEHDRARQAYFRAHRVAIRRQVPGFRPSVEACWSALNAERNRWPGAPENTDLIECKHAKN